MAAEALGFTVGSHVAHSVNSFFIALGDNEFLEPPFVMIQDYKANYLKLYSLLCTRFPPPHQRRERQAGDRLSLPSGIPRHDQFLLGTRNPYIK